LGRFSVASPTGATGRAETATTGAAITATEGDGLAGCGAFFEVEDAVAVEVELVDELPVASHGSAGASEAARTAVGSSEAAKPSEVAEVAGAAEASIVGASLVRRTRLPPRGILYRLVTFLLAC
jgi:hypothetical protein